MNTDHDDVNSEYKPSSTWNKKEKGSHTFLFIMIATVCFLLAWVMS